MDDCKQGEDKTTGIKNLDASVKIRKKSATTSTANEQTIESNPKHAIRAGKLGKSQGVGKVFENFHTKSMESWIKN